MKHFGRKGLRLTSGFTLIEILVATAILAMIFSIIFGTFFYTIENVEEQQERAALYHRANFILNNISQSVSSACVPFGGRYDGRKSERSAFLGTAQSLEDPEAYLLSMFTTNPRFSTGEKAGGIAYVTYDLVPFEETEEAEFLEDEENPIILRCMIEPLFLISDGAGEGQWQWELNVHSLTIEYYDGSEWFQEWSFEDQGVLPDAIRTDLELADSEGERFEFSSIASIHVNTLLEEPVEEKVEEEEQEEETEEEEEPLDEEAPEGDEPEGEPEGEEGTEEPPDDEEL
jgi:prepilin-type N-terminal cleavage/methylation domain-containing protein